MPTTICSYMPLCSRLPYSKSIVFPSGHMKSFLLFPYEKLPYFRLLFLHKVDEVPLQTLPMGRGFPHDDLSNHPGVWLEYSFHPFLLAHTYHTDLFMNPTRAFSSSINLLEVFFFSRQSCHLSKRRLCKKKMESLVWATESHHLLLFSGFPCAQSWMCQCPVMMIAAVLLMWWVGGSESVQLSMCSFVCMIIWCSMSVFSLSGPSSTAGGVFQKTYNPLTQTSGFY